MSDRPDVPFRWLSTTGDTLTAASDRGDWWRAARLLYLAWLDGAVDVEQLAVTLHHAWLGITPFDQVLRPAQWHDLFGAAGYRHDTAPCARPPTPLHLYRGACNERRAGWSWTADAWVAHRYASHAAARCGLGCGGSGVWVAEVEPWRLLALYAADGEYEFVVDARGLPVRARQLPTERV